jgi:uncharacterized protein YcbK (DUF882 family)
LFPNIGHYNLLKNYKIFVLAAVFCGLVVTPAPADTALMKRFFYSGDGYIRLVSAKSGKAFSGRYRKENGQYSGAAYNAICDVFGAPIQSPSQVLSLRLIEFLDYLEGRLGPGALLTITSGYRPPEDNTKLRKRGALAAKASLHQYGMAADFIMEGVSSKRIWQYVRSLGFGGTGYYHGKSVHVDVGPTRFWDENSSGVGSGASDDNKLIGVVTNYDIYASGERLALSFIRMTAFPIEVQPEFKLIAKDSQGHVEEALSFRPAFETLDPRACGKFTNIGQMASFRWRLPSNIRPGRYLIRAGFCGKLWKEMPKEVDTPEFEIRQP